MDDLKQRLITECALGDIGAAKELYRLCGRQEDWATAKVALNTLLEGLIPKSATTSETHAEIHTFFQDEVKDYLRNFFNNTQAYECDVRNSFEKECRNSVDPQEYLSSEPPRFINILNTKVKHQKSLVYLDGFLPVKSADYDYNYIFYVYPRDGSPSNFEYNTEIEVYTSIEREHGYCISSNHQTLRLANCPFREKFRGPSAYTLLNETGSDPVRISVEVRPNKKLRDYNMRLDFIRSSNR